MASLNPWNVTHSEHFLMGQIWPLFVFIRSFHMKIKHKLTIIICVDGVLGTRTRGNRLVGADESAELWQYF